MRSKRSKVSSLDDAASQGEFSEDQIAEALSLFREFRLYVQPEVQPEYWTIEHVRESSAGVRGWLDYHPDVLFKVGKYGLASANLCGLWTRQALCAASEKPHWERVVLTVDSGASDTIIPPSVACNIPLTQSIKTGIECEVANGGVIVNLGERHAKVITTRDGTVPLLMSFQVVQVHKPLLAVSRLIEAGHDVVFNKLTPHII